MAKCRSKLQSDLCHVGKNHHLCKKIEKMRIDILSLTVKPASAALILAAVLSVFGCGKNEGQKVKAPIRVKTEVASAAPFGSQSYVGVVEESEATAVSFTTMGVVRRVYVDEGQAVSRGQLIAEIDPSTMNNTVDAAEASTSQAIDMVQQAEDAYSQAKDAYDRMKILHDNGSLPEMKWVEVTTRLSQAETALRTARSSVRSANATERIARKNLADTRIYAPVSGIIGHRHVNAGETALPSQAVVTILDINHVKVKVSVPESEMRSITPHTASYITVGAIGREFGGGTIEKGVKADPLTHTYDIRINVLNSGHQLLPGMVANVTFSGLGTAPASSGWRTLPVTSVQRRADGSLFVWTIGADSAAHRTTVSIGHATGNRVPITSGLGDDQRVVTEGYQKLSEGTKVTY